ncbi:amino acid/polyamine/organocation transporter, APC superfamily [Shimia gijangensis]|uniref:Amino acid/polyamine/organocation transporter, APC superfamily n=1 Tax=Shimia gijangensis TaxID=1470563 RepID=A0A1M6KW30_9RHOB|nr:APC family permease [Shimia gijangensis]SHJ63177.1 amino acid/polyamine/organocation transporter, APC superfamily [Shimia gijangensis]
MAEHLKRRVGLGLLTAYGVGVMVGAGIYVLVGAVAGEAGLWAPMAFLLAGVIAAPTALSYSEFSSRIPEAAGEAAFVGKSLNSQTLAVLVGLAIVAVGMISAAAVLRGGVGYLTIVLDVPWGWSIVGIGAALTAVAIFGVMESLSLAAVFTVVELLGLVLVVWAGMTAPAVPDWTALPAPVWTGIGAGAVLAFFAFIGFEDIVNMAEEVSNPERTMPRAILIALGVTTLIYALVAVATVRAVPLSLLAGSEKPLALVWQIGMGGDGRFLSSIAVFAALNGVLAQIVMASRVLFGLGRRTPFLAVFHHAHPRTGTPVLASLLVGGAVIVAALFLNVSVLAEATSQILLTVFVIVNFALIVLKRKNPEAPFRVPMIVPVSGLILSAAALAFNLVDVL